MADVRNRILDFFFRNHKEVSFSPDDFVVRSGLEAVRHIFTVASALDSLVIGESQILGQMKEAHAYAVDNGLAGEKLDKIFQQAFKVAKKVRTDTDLGKKSVSMISLATSLIGEIIQSEGATPVALVGAGAMTHKLASFLTGRQVTDLLFVNRTVEKAEALAQQYGGRAMGLDQFLSGGVSARIICTATSSPTPIFTDQSAATLLAANDRILFLDLAIPRDVAIDNTLDDRIAICDILRLKDISERNRRQRFRDVDKAQEIIAHEVVGYHKGKIEEELRPVFSQAHQESRDFAEKGLERLFETRLAHLDGADRATINHWVEKLISYATFLPSRAMAERIARQVGADARAEETPPEYVQTRPRPALRKGA